MLFNKDTNSVIGILLTTIIRLHRKSINVYPPDIFVLKAEFRSLIAPATFVLIWSGAFVAIRAGLPYMSPLTFLSSRFTVACLLLVVFIFLWKNWRVGWKNIRPIWPHLVVAGLLMNAGYLSAAYLAMRDLKAATLALITALAPMLTATISSTAFGQGYTVLKCLGFVLGFIGVGIVVGFEPATLTQTTGLGWAFVSMTSLVIGTIYFNRYCQSTDILPSNCIQLASAAVLCWVMVVLFETPMVQPSLSLLLSFSYLTLAASIGAMLIYLYMLKTHSAEYVISNLYLTPGVSAILGWAILDETFQYSALTGFAISTFGLWLVWRTPNKKKAVIQK